MNRALMNRTFLLSLSSCTAFFIGLALYVGYDAGVEPPAWLPVIGSSAEEPVLVFVVGSPERVARVREAVASDRVVVEGPRAFALREGRIVAAAIEDASLPLNAGGWRHRELELHQIQQRRGNRGSSRPAPAKEGASAAAFSELIDEPELSRAEAMALLEAMDAGPAF